MTELPTRRVVLPDGRLFRENADIWQGFFALALDTPTRMAGEVTGWHVNMDKMLADEEDLEQSMPDGLSALCLYVRRHFESDELAVAMRVHTHKVTANRM